MQLHENINTVSTNSESQAFTIKTSAKAFKILSDNLYSNKIQAVVRELSTNAADSHIAAGNPDPIRVHVPTYDEQWFSVIDYGIGMDNETIMTLYTSYFDSNKSDSNEFTGALGLGSKSPFAYTNSFIVESRYNGKKSLFTAYRGKDGTPQITHMSEVDSDEPNGIEVRVDVHPGDMANFIEEARNIYAFFNPVPLIINNNGENEFKPVNINKTLETESWALYTNISSFGRSSNLYAVMGQVAYPINTENLGDFTHHQNFASSQNAYLYFNLGELDIAPSREALSYDKITVENIKLALENMGEALDLMINNHINSQTCLWDAVIEFKNYTSKNNINTGRYEFKYHGVNVNGFNSFEFSKDELNKLECPISLYEHDYRQGWAKKNLMKDQWAYRINVAIGENVIIVVCDETPLIAARKIKYMLGTKNGNTKAYLIEKNEPSVINKLGGVNFILSSSLDKPPRKTRERQSGVAYKFYAADSSVPYTTKLDNINGSIYYILKKRNKFETHNGLKLYNHGVQRRIDGLVSLNILKKSDVVYFVDGTTALTAAFKNLDKTEITKLYDDALDELVEKKESDIRSFNRANKEITLLTFTDRNSQRIYERIISHAIFDKISQDSPFVEIQSRIKNLKKRMDRLQKNSRFCLAQIEAERRNLYNDVEVKVSMPNLFEHYPMLSMIDWTKIDNNTINKIVDYMNSIDGE